MSVKETRTEFGTYKTGRYQGSNQTWYGFVKKGETYMHFVSKKEYELGIKPLERPPLDELPF